MSALSACKVSTLGKRRPAGAFSPPELAQRFKLLYASPYAEGSRSAMKPEREPKLDLVSKRAEYAVCILDNIIFLAWTGLPSLEGVTACSAAFAKLRATRPATKLGFYTLISEQAQRGTLPEPVRNALGKVLKDNEASIGSAVIAYEGSGFRATIVRSVITAIHLATRLKFPASVHSERRGAAQKMLENLGGETQATSKDIVAVLHNLCARSAA